MKMDRSFHGHWETPVELVLNVETSLALFLWFSLGRKKLKINLVSSGFHQRSLEGLSQSSGETGLCDLWPGTLHARLRCQQQSLPKHNGACCQAALSQGSTGTPGLPTA